MSFKVKTEVIEKERVVDIMCDMCKRSCKVSTDESYDPEFAELEINHGYGSPQDGDHEYAHFCLDCYGKLKEYIQNNGGQINKETAEERHNSCEDEDCPCDHSCDHEDDEEDEGEY